jgi:hypothetical protein
MFIYMFFSMMIIHLFVMPWVMIDSPSDFRLSLNGVYMATFGASVMVLFEAFIHPMSSTGWLLTLGLMIASAAAVRWQIGIDDKQYLQDMIPHHSMAVLTSRARLRRTKDAAVRGLSEGILRSQISEIITMKNMLPR